MKMPTHIVAVGGIVEDEQENILFAVFVKIVAEGKFPH